MAATLTLPAEARSTGDKAYIHLDRRIDLAPYRGELHRAGMEEGTHYELISTREVTTWGDFSLVQATLNLIRASQADSRGFDSLVFLSGQDYPLVSIATMKQRLALTPDAEHLTWFKLPYDKWAPDGGFRRFRRHHHLGLRERIRTSGIPGAHYASVVFAQALALVPKRGVAPGGRTVYGGWQWWVLTPACARYVLEQADSNPGLTRYFRYSFVPDELFFQTVILNSPFADKVTGNYLRHVVWDGIKPRTFSSADLPDLTEAARTALFARKFDGESASGVALLDRLDALRDAGAPVSSPAA